MKLKPTILTVFAFLTAFGAFAQQGSIKGHITTSDGQPAGSVTISLGTAMNTISNASGDYLISRIKTGSYTLRVSSVGLESEEKSVTINSNQQLTVDFVLRQSLAQLQEVVISTDRRTYKINGISSSLRLGGPILEAPQNIQVISSALIKDQQIYDMLEGVTRNVSGVTRSEHWDNYARIIMRGSQIAAFRNGMNVQMPWGPLTEDMSMVERIEFVKGPAGFMMASGEPSGFYNVVTKKPTGVTKGEATLALGSFNTYRATGDLDGKISSNGKFLYRVNVMGSLKDSHRKYDYNDRYTLAPSVTYKISDRTSLTGEYAYQYSETALLGSAYIFGTEGYGTSSRNVSLLEPNMDPTKIRDHSSFLNFNHQFNDNWKFTTQLGFLTFTQIGSSTWPRDYNSDYSAPLSTPGVQPNGDLRRGVGIWDAWGENKLAQAFVNGKLSSGTVNHKLIAGIDMGSKHYAADWGQNYYVPETMTFINIYNPVYGQVPASAVSPYDRSLNVRNRPGATRNHENYTGLYVQDELGFAEDKIRLTLAGRYTMLKQFDGYSPETNDSKFTPRIGLSISANKETSFYALYDQSFLAQSGVIWGGEKAKPLDGINTEIGMKKDWLGGKWNTTLALYNIIKKNVMTTDPDPTHTPVGAYSIQIGKTRVQGIEFDLRGEITKDLNATFNYALTDGDVLNDGGNPAAGSSIDSYAKHVTNGWLSYKMPQGFGVSLGYQWQIDRIAGSWGAANPKNLSLPNYFRTDGAVTWQNSKVNISLNVNNIFDKYLYTGAPYDYYYYWQSEPGINFRLGLGYKF